jgi:hypothetical protein
MSNIHIFPQVAGHAGDTLKRELTSSRELTDKPAKPSDDEMMYAWSIGVTSAAREIAQQPRHEQCECPPEVYIG